MLSIQCVPVAEITCIPSSFRLRLVFCTAPSYTEGAMLASDEAL
jgi:hypothetical protein